ncbi:hypothetical protein [Aestuariivita sp.]|jgi:hypothetical protein|uniref:hypothetical protein n=1 Tax=Aestuariivita sp. TaxID=1872407 RepID=UPI0021715E7D|nr:hypothetical protein [Aestuariivita sp.]MCE8006154.1 hypothetical protein [Aestuariivita sp.]
MVLDRILLRLQIRRIAPERAAELAQLGFMEWLGALPGESDFHQQAMIAYRQAVPLRRQAPAIALFCDLLVASTRMPPEPLDLSLPSPHRRGGARGRRQMN